MHSAVTSKTRPFTGAVGPSLEQNPAAHGGVCEIQICSCGAHRSVNLNGAHEEVGEWDLPHERVNVQAVAATPAMCRQYLVDAAGSTRGREVIEEMLGESASALIERPHRGDDPSTVKIARLIHAVLR